MVFWCLFSWWLLGFEWFIKRLWIKFFTKWLVTYSITYSIKNLFLECSRDTLRTRLLNKIIPTSICINFSSVLLTMSISLVVTLLIKLNLRAIKVTLIESNALNSCIVFFCCYIHYFRLKKTIKWIFKITPSLNLSVLPFLPHHGPHRNAFL